MILLNSSIFQKLLCKLNIHTWRVVGRWREEAIDQDAILEWDDYVCPYCGKWERGIDRENVNWHGYWMWIKIKRKTLPITTTETIKKQEYGRILWGFQEDIL